MQVLPDQRGERVDLIVAVVECRNVFVAFATRVQKAFTILDRDFLERLETVDSEPWTEHLHRPHATAPEVFECRVGIRFELLLAAYARLEADDQ